jgi:uncharacterized phage protein (TIGR02218 family)
VTYDASERSLAGGAPVELYTFVTGAITRRYTSADADIVVDGNSYTAAVLQRSVIATTAERARNALQITCARDFPIAELFRVAPPSEIIALTVRRVHRGDTDVAVGWMGRVVNCEWQAGSTARLNCEPVSASLRRMGLRRKYQRQCPHVLYLQGPGQCNVNRATHSTTTTITSVTGTLIGVASLPSKPWPGGFAEWTLPDGSIERRFIEAVPSAGVLKITQAFQGITIGQTVTISPGCDHTTATCASVYSNLDNYGGFPFIPLKNPFNGTPVY